MDEFPLASLPLLGYTVGPPNADDNIMKDYVFKLQYKNHVYFFRAESDYTYNRYVFVSSKKEKGSEENNCIFFRWMEVIGSAAQNKSKKKSCVANENSIECSPEK